MREQFGQHLRVRVAPPGGRSGYSPAARAASEGARTSASEAGGLQQPREKFGARLEAGHVDVLVPGVRAGAGGAEPVEDRDAERADEVPI